MERKKNDFYGIHMIRNKEMDRKDVRKESNRNKEEEEDHGWKLW